jgi:hypothetical protein
MKWLLLLIVVVLIILFIPFYVYILSKCATLGKINTLKQIFKKEQQDEEKGKQVQTGSRR